jgi:hypothetical protein
VRAWPLVVAAVCVVGRAHGFGGGVSGRSGAPGAGSCADCHGGAAAPTVTIIGPSTIAAGSAASYRLDIVTGASTRGASWDVAVVGDAALGVESGPPAAQILDGELTHTAMHASGATVSVPFTLRPGSAGQLMLYANALSSDGSGTGGDGTGAAQLAITVEPPPDLAGLDLAGLDLAEPADLAAPLDLATPSKPPPADEPQWACACDVGRGRGHDRAPAPPPVAVLFAVVALTLTLTRRRCMVPPCAPHSSSAPPGSSAATSSTSCSPIPPTRR